MEQASKRLIFMDGEFTRLTAKGIKFLSIAFITEDNKELYLEIQQPVKDIDLWVKENVLPLMDSKNIVAEEKAKQKILDFIRENYKGEKPILVADVNQFDWNGICNLFGVWNVPFYFAPIDFSTILYLKGYNMGIDRIELAKELGMDITGKQHNALTDTRILKHCWNKLVDKKGEF